MKGPQDQGVTHRHAGPARPSKSIQEVPKSLWLDCKFGRKFTHNLLKCCCGPTPGTILSISEFSHTQSVGRFQFKSVWRRTVQKVWLFLGQGDEMRFVRIHHLKKTLRFSKKAIISEVGGTLWR